MLWSRPVRGGQVQVGGSVALLRNPSVNLVLSCNAYIPYRWCRWWRYYGLPRSKICSRRNQNVRYHRRNRCASSRWNLTKVKGTNTIFITGEDGIELGLPSSLMSSRVIVEDGGCILRGARSCRIVPLTLMTLACNGGYRSNQRYPSTKHKKSRINLGW